MKGSNQASDGALRQATFDAFDIDGCFAKKNHGKYSSDLSFFPYLSSDRRPSNVKQQIQEMKLLGNIFLASRQQLGLPLCGNKRPTKNGLVELIPQLF